MRELTNGYVVMCRNGEFEHELEGDLYEALSQAVDRLKIAVLLVQVMRLNTYNEITGGNYYLGVYFLDISY